MLIKGEGAVPVKKEGLFREEGLFRSKAGDYSD